MKVACIGTVIKSRLNDMFYKSVESVKNQDFKDYDIFMCYSKEPFWLDDGINNPPHIDNVTWVEVENTACMRFFEYSLRELINYDYAIIFGADCIFQNDYLKTILSYATKDKVYGIIGKTIVPYGWDEVGYNSTAIEVDVLSSIGITFNPKLLLNAGVLNWRRECPLAVMDDEYWVNGCLARKGIDRVMIPYNCSYIQVDKGNSNSVCVYNNNIKRAPSIGISFYFKDYWSDFK